MNTRMSRRTLVAFTSVTAFTAAKGRSAGLQAAGVASQSEPIEQVCKGYLSAWARKDLEGIATRLHPAIQFKSPTAETNGRDQYLAATARILPLLERIDVRAQFISGDRAMFAYDF